MRKILCCLTFIAMVIMAAPAMAQPAAIGEPAPDFTLTDTNGNTHTLSDYHGKTVVLEWTNHECPYVRKHYETGNMQALQKEAAENGTIWLTIASSAPGKQGYTTPEEANRIIEEQGAHATARLMDPTGEVGQMYGAKTTPHMFVIDAQGTLAYEGAIDDMPTTDHGTIEGAHNYVRAALASLAAGEPVDTAQTKPYGCAVKYPNH